MINRRNYLDQFTYDFRQILSNGNHAFRCKHRKCLCYIHISVENLNKINQNKEFNKKDNIEYKLFKNHNCLLDSLIENKESNNYLNEIKYKNKIKKLLNRLLL